MYKEEGVTNGIKDNLKGLGNKLDILKLNLFLKLRESPILAMPL